MELEKITLLMIGFFNCIMIQVRRAAFLFLSLLAYNGDKSE